MKASGNGDVKVCVGNLLRIWRGEVPYERVKGIDPRLVDKPTATVSPEVQQDAWWLLETYEPRAEVENVTAAHDGRTDGNMLITASLKGKGEVTNV